VELPEESWADLPAIPRLSHDDDSPWLIRFIAIVCILGAIAITLIALLR
jgi:hypothetical protein